MLECKFGCTRQFRTLEAMADHRRASHSNPSSESKGKSMNKFIACNDCGKLFLNIDALRQHQMSSTDHTRVAKELGSLRCELCPRTLRDQAALEQHFIADHSVIQLRPGDHTRTELERQFKENWRKHTRCGVVQSVFQVYNAGWRMSKFEKYRLSLTNRGNEVRRYHGTSLLCDLGMGGTNSKLCQLLNCNLCSILRSGFKTAKARTGWQRFGKGIYTTATSGKSDDYIRSSSSRRAVLVCRVLAGNVFRTMTNIPHLDSPPEGYDSVSGEVGQHLNFDETVVYTSKAILPSYMIVYTAP